MFKYTSRTWFVGGLVAGFFACYAVLRVGGFSIVSQQDLERQQELVSELQEENLELTDDLFKPRVLSEFDFEGDELPYDDTADARAMVASARKQAREERKFLMVTFGANWCMDCRTLHRNLNSEVVKPYTRDLFHFVNVDVGKFNQNVDVALELGVDLSNGIPVALFFAPDGEVIGTTNEGQLEPARRYTSKQILRFVKDIAEQSRIMAPDAVRK